MSDSCRCGFQGKDNHPCHGNGYTCKAPAIERLITYPTALAGMQVKLGAYQTWSCDSCWEAYQLFHKK